MLAPILLQVMNSLSQAKSSIFVSVVHFLLPEDLTFRS